MRQVVAAYDGVVVNFCSRVITQSNGTIAIAVLGAGGVEVYDNIIKGFDFGFFIYDEPSYTVPEEKRALYNDTKMTTAIVYKNTFSNSTNSTIYNAVPDYKLPATINYFENATGHPIADPQETVHGDVELGAWSTSSDFTSFAGAGTSTSYQIATTVIHSENLCGISIENDWLAFPNTVHGTVSAPLRNTVHNIGTAYVEKLVLDATPWTKLEGAETLYKGAADTDYMVLDGISELSGDSLIRVGPTVDTLGLDFKLDLTDTDAVSYTHLPSPRDRQKSRMPSSA